MTRPLPLFLALLASAVPSFAAQSPTPTPPTPPTLQPADPTDPVEKLGRYLRILSTSPRDLEALTGAGRAALDVGDANAAIGFYARAEEIAPRDGRIKAGLASALVQMEQPKEALKLFGQATDLGVPTASIAADRGLAYDLRGDNRRAQADYMLALKTTPDDETVRRLALSQAMSGDRTAAMATLDPLLRKQDKAAWRASTFVLALTGDDKAAVTRLGLLVSPPQATALAPFLGKLASLRPAEQAEAVHFGHLPADRRAPAGTALAATESTASIGSPTAPSSLARSGYADAFAATTAAAPASRAPRRRPGADAVTTEPAASPVALAGNAVSLPSALAFAPAASPTETAATTPTPVATATANLRAGAPGTGVPLGPALTAVSVPPSAAATDAPLPAIETAIAPSSPTLATAVPTDKLPASPVGPVDPRFVEPAAAAPVPAVAANVGPTLEAEARPIIPRGAEAGTPAGPRPSAKPQPSRSAGAETTAKPSKSTTREPAIKLADAGSDIKALRGSKIERDDAPADESPKPGSRASNKADAAKPGKSKRGAPSGEDGAKPDTRTARADAAKGAKIDKADKARRTADAARADKEKRAADAAKAEKTKTATASRKEPQRYWVQVATGANKADLPKAWAKVKTQYPQLMSGKSPWTTPLRFTNRILIGPFKSGDEAQAFVNTSGKAGFGTSRFTSPPGQAVERLGGK